jgi:hypothetical protein
VVHDAVEAVGRLQNRNARTLLALTCCVVLLGACGSSSSSTGSKDRPADLPKAPPVGSVRSADCSDWKKGSVDQRHATVAALRGFASGPVGSSAGIQKGPVLEDARAYRVLQSYCRNYFARGFKLYKLYERAAAFVGH